jgi:hypothetical protein
VFQVTLMSGLYVSFACSLVAAANRKAKERKSGPAWDRLKGGDDYQRPAGSVVGFLSSWFAVHGDDSLVQAFPSGALVHERTPTYARLDDGSYPPVQGYFSDAYWSGDQGLIMGALKQYDGVGTRSPEMLDQATASDGAAAGAADADMTGYPMKLLIGVFYNIRANDLPNAVGPYLDPSGSSPLTSDDNDYGSGSGIFWRYVLRCCRLDPSFKAEAAADATVASIAQSSGTHPNDWGNELFQPFNTVAAAIGAWYLLK